jgi:hypothetical protein
MPEGLQPGKPTTSDLRIQLWCTATRSHLVTVRVEEVRLHV